MYSVRADGSKNNEVPEMRETPTCPLLENASAKEEEETRVAVRAAKVNFIISVSTLGRCEGFVRVEMRATQL